MNGIDFLKLMKDGLEGATQSDLEALVQSLMPAALALKELSLSVLDAVVGFVGDMFDITSKESVKRRERIIRRAEHEHANPGQRSKYCLRVLRIEFSQWCKKQLARELFPENPKINRQVEDHLRKLRKEGLIRSQEKRGRSGNILAVLHGLPKWGPEMQKRSRRIVPQDTRNIQAAVDTRSRYPLP
jgi:hypothetical protein